MGADQLYQKACWNRATTPHQQRQCVLRRTADSAAALPASDGQSRVHGGPMWRT